MANYSMGGTLPKIPARTTMVMARLDGQGKMLELVEGGNTRKCMV